MKKSLVSDLNQRLIQTSGRFVAKSMPHLHKGGITLITEGKSGIY